MSTTGRRQTKQAKFTAQEKNVYPQMTRMTQMKESDLQSEWAVFCRRLYQSALRLTLNTSLPAVDAKRATTCPAILAVQPLRRYSRCNLIATRSSQILQRQCRCTAWMAEQVPAMTAFLPMGQSQSGLVLSASSADKPLWRRGFESSACRKQVCFGTNRQIISEAGIL